MSSERDSALKTLAAEQIVLTELRKTEVNRLKVLKEKNAQLELLAIQRDNVMEELRKDKDEIFKLKQKDRERLEAEAKELKKYQSKFFAEVEKALGNQKGIKIKGDRFIFSSEILFEKGKPTWTYQRPRPDPRAPWSPMGFDVALQCMQPKHTQTPSLMEP